MAFNLPPPWDPGFALPDNVRDEGLERHAYITKWMPRGTYDDPKLPQSRFAVPTYVKDEGYGQGAFTTKWVPRATYWPRVPHWLNARPQIVAQQKLPGGGTESEIARAQLSGLGGTGYVRTGGGGQGAHDRVAGQIMARVRALPKEQRAKTLRASLDLIHPTLKDRAEKYAVAARRSGMSASDALHHGIATALSERPRPSSQSGQRRGLGDNIQSSALSQVLGVPVGGKPAKAMAVGPFTLSYNENEAVTYKTSMLTPTQQLALRDYILKTAMFVIQSCGVPGTIGYDPSKCRPTQDLRDFKMSSLTSGNMMVPPYTVNGTYPAAYFDHPETGRRQAVFFKFASGADPTVTIWWQENRTLLELLKDGLTALVAAVIDLAKQIVCGVAGSSPGGAVVIGAATGTGGAIGAVCGGAPQVLPPQSSSPILPLAIAAGGIALVAILLAGRKKTTP